MTAGRLTVIDATNLQSEGRKPLLILANKTHVPLVAIVFALPEDVCQRQNQLRPQRVVPTNVVSSHWQQLQHTLAALEREHFQQIFVLRNPKDITTAKVDRQPLPVDRRAELGPFDIIGDVHGCFDELVQLLQLLGYEVHPREPLVDGAGFAVRGPEGRKIVFVGDLVDRGPRTPAVLWLVMSMVKTGLALSVRGNHDDKLLRKLQGREVRLTHGLAESMAQLSHEPPGFLDRARDFLETLPSHYVLDDGKLVVAHAGIKEEMQGRMSERVRVFSLFGDTTGETDADGLPVRRLGGRLSRSGPGGLRPYAGPGADSRATDHQHRHRLRLRWQAHGVALSGAGVSVGVGGAAVLCAAPGAAHQPGCGDAIARGLAARGSVAAGSVTATGFDQSPPRKGFGKGRRPSGHRFHPPWPLP